MILLYKVIDLKFVNASLYYNGVHFFNNQVLSSYYADVQVIIYNTYNVVKENIFCTNAWG